MSNDRETLELDVVFVGAGPASLAGAYHLGQLIKRHNASLPPGGRKLEPAIAVLEKGKEIGAHALSGAVVDPRALRELCPEDWQQAPFEGAVEREKLLFLTSGKALSLPIPPMLDNHGKYVASLGKLVKWLAPKVEALGIDVFCEFTGAEILLEDGKVVGVRTGDKGRDHHGQPKANFEAGIDIRAQVTVLGEGPRGTLTKQLDATLGLSAGKNPQTYAIGVKEVWELPAGRIQPGDVTHTMGYPLGTSTFGGGFAYGMQGDLFIVGLVVGLDYENPWLDPHQEFQRWKTHPHFRQLLDGGKMAFYGAKAVPEGGWWSMPRLAGDGFLIIGDSGSFLNSQKLKGIHLAIKSGMLAAETIFEGLVAGDTSGAQLAKFQTKVDESWVREELWPVRNFHQGFDHGMFGGMLQAGLGLVTGGRGFGVKDRVATHAGHQRMHRLDQPGAPKPPAAVAFDGKLTFDKLADVYNSGTAHEENQPVHLRVADTELCVTRCTVEYGNPCQRFCPAAVYEIVAAPQHATGKRLQINASNCVHCKTCDIMDPYQIITWVPPEGGGGPNYSKM
jgi:electron-transferring-flavoprotein dehydrogenase